MIPKHIEKLLPKVEKPGRYIGGETGAVYKDKTQNLLRYAFCFPDVYEVGMSHLGLHILYGLLNEREDTWCERAFAPWPDMEENLRKNNIPLFALESMDSLLDFDFIGFTLQYELSYTNILNMLDLANIPLYASNRKNTDPIIMMGGPCVSNPEPIAEFADLIVIGEGEEVLLKLIDLYRAEKAAGFDRNSYLLKAAKLTGVYVPFLYDVLYSDDNTILAIKPNREDVPCSVKKAVVADIDSAYYPKTTPVPLIEAVHDRVTLELFRGCIRGCRFCQAGMIYRPVREKTPETLIKQAKSLCLSTGCDELSLSSLSTSDYSRLADLISGLSKWCADRNINLALPSLRIDNFPAELMESIDKVRKSGLTFAPEAGTQRLRDAINKNITERDILDSCKTAFSSGRTSVKLYFMIGLPTETDEDILGIARLAESIVHIFYQNPYRPKGKSVKITISLSTFVPKAHTPFQWAGQNTLSEIKRKQILLKNAIKSKKIVLNYHDSRTSFLEAALARADRRVSKVIFEAWQEGCRFDGWNEHFNYEKWLSAFEKAQIDPSFYANRLISMKEALPWSHLDYGVTASFLQKEAERARLSETTENCREGCSGCGVSALYGGACIDAHAD